MPNPLTWLMGGSKAAEAVVTNVASGIDKIAFTEEEKADLRIKAHELWLKGLAIIQDESSVRSVTRRILAVSVTAHWIALQALSVGLYFSDREFSAFCFEMARENDWIVGGVLMFYFGPNMIGREIRKIKAG